MISFFILTSVQNEASNFFPIIIDHSCCIVFYLCFCFYHVYQLLLEPSSDFTAIHFEALALKTLLIFVDVLVILVFKNLASEFNDYDRGDRVIDKTGDYVRPISLPSKSKATRINDVRKSEVPIENRYTQGPGQIPEYDYIGGNSASDVYETVERPIDESAYQTFN